ncbi:hypothetical protein NX059_002843 [Plenodomus lindquistii]|nr:hypothetical protein NX059_002843 [Plenodomus lindquistii]
MHMLQALYPPHDRHVRVSRRWLFALHGAPAASMTLSTYVQVWAALDFDPAILRAHLSCSYGLSFDADDIVMIVIITGILPTGYGPSSPWSPLSLPQVGTYFFATYANIFSNMAQQQPYHIVIVST